MQLRIVDMTCGGCVRAVTNAIQSLDPSAEVSADLATHIVDVRTTTPQAAVEQRLAAAGFPAQPVNAGQGA